MDIFGIGIPELTFVVLLALILLGPKDMVKTARSIGQTMRKIVTSDTWRVLKDTSQEIRTLPNRLMREANQDFGELERDLNAPVGANLENYGTWENNKPVISPPAHSIAVDAEQPVDSDTSPTQQPADKTAESTDHA